MTTIGKDFTIHLTPDIMHYILFGAQIEIEKANEPTNDHNFEYT